jgi:hypothetical protein
LVSVTPASADISPLSVSVSVAFCTFTVVLLDNRNGEAIVWLPLGTLIDPPPVAAEIVRVPGPAIVYRLGFWNFSVPAVCG